MTDDTTSVRLLVFDAMVLQLLVIRPVGHLGRTARQERPLPASAASLCSDISGTGKIGETSVVGGRD